MKETRYLRRQLPPPAELALTVPYRYTTASCRTGPGPQRLRGRYSLRLQTQRFCEDHCTGLGDTSMMGSLPCFPIQGRHNLLRIKSELFTSTGFVFLLRELGTAAPHLQSAVIEFICSRDKSTDHKFTEISSRNKDLPSSQTLYGVFTCSPCPSFFPSDRYR